MLGRPVEGLVPDLRGARVMLCGPAAQMRAARELLVGLGVPNEEVHEEAFVSPPPPKDEREVDATMMAPEAEATDPGGEYTVYFKKSGKRVRLAGMTILEAAEEKA